MGYTPAFDTIYTGSLCGRWPAAAVWATLLPLADRDGVINLSYQAIAALTGWPMDLLRQGIKELEEPDPDSRSTAMQGCRLIRLRPEREWGWKLVNHSFYREKARLSRKNEHEVQTGVNKDRMQDRRGPPGTAADPLSDSYSDSSNQDLSQSEMLERGRGWKRAPRPPSEQILAKARAVCPLVPLSDFVDEFMAIEFAKTRKDVDGTFINLARRRQRELERDQRFLTRTPLPNQEDERRRKEAARERDRIAQAPVPVRKKETDEQRRERQAKLQQALRGSVKKVGGE